MTDEQLEKFVKERYEERTAYEARHAPSLNARFAWTVPGMNLSDATGGMAVTREP